MRQTLLTSPFQSLIGEHLTFAGRLFQQDKFDAKNADDLIQRCAEAGRVELIMSHSFGSWKPVQTSGQCPNFELKLELNKGITKILKNELKKQEEE
jgi:hypothetical protein